MSVQRRFLIASWDGGGNTPPAYNLGIRLRRRGHQVRMLGWESMAAGAADADLEFVPYPSMEPWPSDLSLDDGWNRAQELLDGTQTRDDMYSLVSCRGFCSVRSGSS